MPLRINRILLTVLTAMALMGLAGPASAGAGDDAPNQAVAEDVQHIQPQLILPQMFPDKTALELMQLGKDLAQHKELEARIKAGEKIEYGQLTVNSQPEGAGVMVSSYVPLGQTPYTNEKLLPGLQRITVRKEGYYEQVRMVEIKANQRASMDFTLQPIPYARLTVKVRPPTTKVSIVEVEEPYTPGMKLVPGRYFVSLRHPSYGDKRLCAVLGENQDVTLNGDLTAWSGNLKMVSNPPEATVFVDGRPPFIGDKSKGEFLINPGPHLVQVWKSLHKPASVLIQAESNKTITAKVDLTPVEHFTNSVGMEFVQIPAGQFMMGFNGSPEHLAEQIIERQGFFLGDGMSVYNAFYQAYPQHLVQITEPFFMQTTEVTRAEWKNAMGVASESDGEEDQWPHNFEHAEDIEKFLAKLNRMDNGRRHYRLPTEAEWEYAARAGTKGLFFTGNYISTKQANFIGKPFSATGWVFGKTRDHRIKVKSFPPNPWGLYDMHGNALEVCSDWFDGFYYTYSPIKNPRNKAQGEGYYVIRGGSALARWTRCMSGYRDYVYFGKGRFGCGLRLVAEMVKKQR